MFFEDAERGSKLLDIALTKRLKSVPLAGFPIHALDNHLEKLIRKGVMVAICDQTEQVRVGRKSTTFKREVTRLVTPGTVIEDKILDSRRNNYLVSIYLDSISQRIGISWLDISTGEFGVTSELISNLAFELGRLSPSEILITQNLLTHESIRNSLKGYTTTIQPEEVFSVQKGSESLSSKTSKGMSNMFSSSEFAATGAILFYIEQTQKGKTPFLEDPVLYSGRDIVKIDPFTRKALELNETQSGSKGNSVVHILDKTITPGGARLLNSRINAPIKSLYEIDNRLDYIQFFVENPLLVEKVTQILKKVHDIERSFQRISIERGSPRDLFAIRVTLEESIEIKRELVEYVDTYLPRDMVKPNHLFSKENLPALLLESLNTLSFEMHHLMNTLSKSIIDTPSLSFVNFIKEGYHQQLDDLRLTRDKHETIIQEMVDKYKILTQINNLKIRYTRNLGYYVEISHKDEAKILKCIDVQFIHCQTKVHTLCYKTQEIVDIETKMSRATYECEEIEQSLFKEISALVISHGSIIKKIARTLSVIDFTCSCAIMALEKGYTRPLVDESKDFFVESGRHVSVETASLDWSFIPNDCSLNDKTKIWLITGANMGGKSTFLRQNALICIMAQAGMFVPAKIARLGIVDAVYTRVGAFDDLSNNRSTFMVEMMETAAILNNATDRSFVLLDEIGRGTSTIDGLSIAWSVLEYLHDTIGCKTLFATHFHELNTLSTLPKMSCYHMGVVENNQSVIFTHKVLPGENHRSYGVHVAKLSGIPDQVINRSFVILDILNKERTSLPILENTIQNVDVNKLTPMKALELIQQLQEKIQYSRRREN